MAEHLEANGVRMWFDDRSAGDPVVLLHGGLTDSRDFTGNLDALAGQFRLLLPERRGHGHTPDVPGPVTVEAMGQDTIAFLNAVTGGPVRLADYSAGATVALRVVSEADLRRMHGIGPKAIRQLREALAAAGLSLAAKS